MDPVVGGKSVRGVECLLDPGQVATVLGRPVRWVREQLLQTGVLRSCRLGGNSYRVAPSELREFIARGHGWRHSRPSGSSGKKMPPPGGCRDGG